MADEDEGRVGPQGQPRITVRPLGTAQMRGEPDPWAVQAHEPLKLQVPPPTGPWAVQSQTPAAAPSSNPWAVQTHTPVAQEPSQSFFEKALRLSPVPGVKPMVDIATSPTYQDMTAESREQMAHGVEQLGTSGERLKGAFNTTVGGIGYATAPVNAPVRDIVGKPVEQATGIPKEYSEFATTLALPVLGFGKTPKTLQKIFSPETVSQEAMDAAALIRQNTGRAARATETTATTLESYWKPVSQMPPAEQLGIMHYIEGTGPAPRTPQMRALADTLKDAFETRKQALQALPDYAHRQFLEDYFPHFWKDPNAAANVFGGGAGGAKQGSGASLRTRTIPTMADGIKNGLVPLSTNPIEATLRYVSSMDRFIAAQQTLDAAKASGTVVYVKPQVMGASGHPDSLKGIPQGYAPLNGRGATNASGARAYAPEAWARVYNNFTSRGFGELGTEYQNAYDVMRRGANATTQMLLSFSGYHAFTMAEASMSNQLAKVVAEMRNLHPLRAAKELGGWAASPVKYAAQGKTFKDMYTGKVPMTPEQTKVIDLLTDAGGRLSGTKHILDYEASALGDYVTSFRRGKLNAELLSQLQDVKNRPVLGTIKTVASNVGRVMDTFNKPLFQHYIPSMKNAAAYENMAQWLRNNPAATLAEQQAAARKVVDSVDNRFGEMIHDNIFWNKVAKQSAMLGMLSYSWNMGGIREIGGGVRDIARTTLKGEQWTPKADYVIAMALNWAIMSAIYQGLKTGEAPKDVHDLMAPRTGGYDVRTGEPERIIPPGIMKDVFGYWEHFGQEAANKVNPGVKIAAQSASILGGKGGSDWRDDPILSPREEGQTAWEKAPDWLAEYFAFVMRSAQPIQSQNLTRGKEEGSNINALEQLLGIRKAPRQLVAPEEHDKMMRSMWERRWRSKQRHDAAEDRRYGGTD